jgi:microcystin-dependent protein
MAYPPYLARITHFTFDATAGIDSPAPSGVDAELNSLLESVNQQNLFIRRITTADGNLKNLAVATAQALAGTQEFVATASQTAFLTSIAWSSSFSNLNVMVFSGSTRFATSAVAVADSGGFLQVTLAAQALNTSITVFAFESGAGLLTRLQTVSASDGAHLLAIEDAGAYTAVATVEAAIQELYDHTQGAAGKTWLEGVLVMSGYLAKTGGTMTGNIAMSTGATVTGLPASASNGQAVRHEQIVALQSSITGITSIFMPKSGGTFTGPVNFGSQTTTGVVTPTTSDAIASKGYVDTTLASFGGLPVGTMVDFAAASAPTGWLLCDGATISRTVYASLFAAIGVGFGAGDGVTTFAVPDFRGRVAVGSGAGSGLTARTLAQTGGEETHVLTIAEMPAHTHDIISNSSDSGFTGTPRADGDAADSTTATQSRGLDGAHNTMQPFLVATKIIKY